jgi:hypothetical protein
MIHIPTGKWDDSIYIVTVLENLFVKVLTDASAMVSAHLNAAQEVR